MVPRPSFMFLFCLLVSIVFSNGQPPNPSAKLPTKAKPQLVEQSFVVNNNCGLAKAEREMMAHIKAKVDFIAKQCKNESACTTGWVPYGKSCYLVIDVPTLEWNDARRNCQKLGGDLAKITSAAENQFIYDLLTKQKKTTAHGAWLGLHCKADKKFYWADGTPLTGYAAWAAGEPNNQAEEYTHMRGLGSAKGKWNDLYCTRNKADIAWAPVVLCQKNSQ